MEQSIPRFQLTILMAIISFKKRFVAVSKSYYLMRSCLAE